MAQNAGLWTWQSTAVILNHIDLGCGTGTMLEVLGHLGFRGSVAGCQISAGMIRKALFLAGPLGQVSAEFVSGTRNRLAVRRPREMLGPREQRLGTNASRLGSCW